MEQVNVFSSENNAVGACAQLLVCVENNADSSEKKVMNLIIIILFHVFSMFMSMCCQEGPETSAGMMMSMRR